MSEEMQEDDEWLYGESSEGGKRKEGENVGEDAEFKKEPSPGENEAGEAGNVADEDKGEDNEQKNGSGDDYDDDDDSDDDDGVQVVIDLKSGQSFTAAAKVTAPPPDKKGKFSVEDFETPGTINGVPAQDFNLDTLEDKPWRKPGADITDYFNYGFTEDTWRAYCDRQKRLRFESGTNLPINPNTIKIQERTSGPTGGGHITIPRLGGRFDQNRRKEEVVRIRRNEEPKENTIQVMTADRREYSRKTFEMAQQPIPPPFDMSMPPPPFPGPPQDFPPPDFYHPPPFYQPPPHHDDYGDDDRNWMDSSWNEMGQHPDHHQDHHRPSMDSMSKNIPPPPPGDEPKSSK